MTKSERILMYYQTKLMKEHGTTKGDSLLYPLRWYINTGRASTQFIHRLADARAKDVVAILTQGGSTEEVIARLKEYLFR